MSLLSRIAHALGIVADDEPVIRPAPAPMHWTLLITCPDHGDTAAVGPRLNVGLMTIEWDCPAGHPVSSPLRLDSQAWRDAALLLAGDVTVPDRLPWWLT